MTRSVSMFLAVLVTLTTGCATHHVAPAPPVPAAPAPLSEQLLDAELRACVAEPDPAACFDSESRKTTDFFQLLTIELARTQWRLVEAERKTEKDEADTEDEPAVGPTLTSTVPRIVGMGAPAGSSDSMFTLDDMAFTSPPLAEQAWNDCLSCARVHSTYRFYGEDAVVSVEKGGVAMMVGARSPTGPVARMVMVTGASGQVEERPVALARDDLYLVWSPGESAVYTFVIYKVDPTTGAYVEADRTTRTFRAKNWDLPICF